MRLIAVYTMTKNTVARRYAQALFNLIDPADRIQVKDALQAMAVGMGESVSLKHALASPVFTFEEKDSVLTALGEKTNSPPIMKDFLGQLLKKNRVTFLPEIAEAFKKLSDQEQGKQTIWVKSAQALEESEKTRLRTELGEMIKKDVEIVFHTEPSLMSGLQVRVGSKVYDNTIKGRLTKMRALLAKG